MAKYRVSQAVSWPTNPLWSQLILRSLILPWSLKRKIKMWSLSKSLPLLGIPANSFACVPKITTWHVTVFVVSSKTWLFTVLSRLGKNPWWLTKVLCPLRGFYLWRHHLKVQMQLLHLHRIMTAYDLSPYPDRRRRIQCRFLFTECIRGSRVVGWWFSCYLNYSEVNRKQYLNNSKFKI